MAGYVIIYPNVLRRKIMLSTKQIYQQLNKFVESGTTVALATIIEIRGSVPREVASKMIIHPLGQHIGTIGGGCGEAEVIKIGLDVIENGQPEVVTVDLTDDITMQSLGVCGGIMQVFIERW